LFIFVPCSFQCTIHGGKDRELMRLKKLAQGIVGICMRGDANGESCGDSVNYNEVE
jgi:hypothetical protein